MDRVSDLSSLRNLGPRTEMWLNGIGIFTQADLERIGSVNIHRILKENGYPVSLNLVWAIEGARADLDWRELSEDLKADLRRQIIVR
ncbi:MAG: TfoX/Sxy family protein [bacterium]|nr:TfoX/Sxy family protein [bacterium]